MERWVDAIQTLVRPFVTLGFAGAMIAGWFAGRLSDDAFLGIAGLVIGFWFQGRQHRDGGSSPAGLKGDKNGPA